MHHRRLLCLHLTVTSLLTWNAPEAKQCAFSCNMHIRPAVSTYLVHAARAYCASRVGEVGTLRYTTSSIPRNPTYNAPPLAVSRLYRCCNDKQAQREIGKHPLDETPQFTPPPFFQKAAGSSLGILRGSISFWVWQNWIKIPAPLVKRETNYCSSRCDVRAVPS